MNTNGMLDTDIDIDTGHQSCDYRDQGVNIPYVNINI